MSGFLPADVIREVKARPGIYNKEVLIPPRREQRQQLWMEVAESVTPREEWENYTQEQKEIRVSEVSNKWKNLRDHFYREVKLVESGEDYKKRKYIYFDDMQFVRPYIGYKTPPANKRPRKNNDSTNSILDDTEIDMDDYLQLRDKVVTDEPKKFRKNDTLRSTRYSLLKNSSKSETKKISSHSAKGVIDNFEIIKKVGSDKNPTFKIRESDISFCLSLVPTLRELTGVRKLSAKIDILKVLRENLEQTERERRSTSVETEDEDTEYFKKYTINKRKDPLNNSSIKKK